MEAAGGGHRRRLGRRARGGLICWRKPDRGGARSPASPACKARWPQKGHVERYAADLIAAGVEPEEARRRARIEFGSTAAAIATLALCIGANTAIFSVVDAVLLRPLPYPQPERLLSVARHCRGKNADGYQTNLWGAAWEGVRDHASYVDAAVFSDGSMGVNFAAGGGVQYVKQQRISAGFFRVLGIAPLIGREFTAVEDRAGGPPVTILSYALWERAFRADPAIVGQAVNLRANRIPSSACCPPISRASFRPTCGRRFARPGPARARGPIMPWWSACARA